MFVCQFLPTSLRHKSTFTLQRQWKSTFSFAWTFKKMELLSDVVGEQQERSRRNWCSHLVRCCALWEAGALPRLRSRESRPMSRSVGTCSCLQALEHQAVAWLVPAKGASPPRARAGCISATPATWDISDGWDQDRLVSVGLGQPRDPKHC